MTRFRFGRIATLAAMVTLALGCAAYNGAEIRDADVASAILADTATCRGRFREGLAVGDTVATAFVCFESPIPGERLGAALRVRGFAAGSFEQKLVVELRDASDAVLLRVPTTANAPQPGLVIGAWSAELAVPPGASGTGSVVAFGTSPRDGSVLFEERVRVVFGGAE